MENVIQIQYYQSPCGELILGAYREKLCLCDWKIEERRIIIDRRIQKELQASYKEGISEVITRTIGQLMNILPDEELHSIFLCFL